MNFEIATKQEILNMKSFEDVQQATRNVTSNEKCTPDVIDSVGCLLCKNLVRCRFCIESNDCEDCSYIFDSSRCENSHYIYSSSSLVGCRNCVACVALYNEEFHICNVEFTKKEYYFLLSSWGFLDAKSFFVRNKGV